MASTASPPLPEINGRAVYRRITLRLIPYMFLLYILAYLDRVNVGYAAMQMKADLHMSNAAYGTGAGLFFIGSALFDIPSNLILSRVGPRRWMARIMITWGAVAAAMTLVRTPHEFYAARFLLGISEAGFFPGMILYLTYWFPSRERARAVSRFMTATAIAGVIGGPVAGSLLSLNGVAGLHGWQWLFLSEGLPTAIAGVSVLFLLKERPRDAAWLRDDERDWLEKELERDREQQGSGAHRSFAAALKLPAVYLLAAVFFADQVCVYVINLWLPLFLHNAATASHLSAAALDRLTALPYLVTAVGMVLIGWSSDRFGDRRWHVAGCLAGTAVALVFAVHAHTLWPVLFAFTVAALGAFAAEGPFFTWLTSMLEGTAAAGGIAVITCIGGFGAFLGQITVGRLSTQSHSFDSGLYTVAAVAVAGSLLALVLRNPASRLPGKT